MKVLGIIDKNYRRSYICEISAEEINDIYNNAYEKDRKFMQELKVGDVHDLGIGYKFCHDLKNLFEKFQSSHETFLKANETLFEFSKLMAGQSKTTKSSD